MLAACLLPHDRYARFRALIDFAVLKASWIYERIHYDPTPIDVVVLGTSHAAFGLDSARVESALREASGREWHVANFAMQHLGRDLHWLLLRETLQARRIKLLVIEVQEEEPRALHPAFGALADPADLLRAPAVINTDYLDDLVHLPLRQIRLFVRRALGQSPRFDPADYAGTHWDDSLIPRDSRGPLPGVAPRTAVLDPAVLDAQRRRAERRAAARVQLPGPLQPLERRANLVYLRRMLEAAAQAGVAVRFLYMPSWRTEAPPDSAAEYRGGPLWYPREVYLPAGHWTDVGHLNRAGTLALSGWLGRTLAADPVLATPP